MPVSNEKAKYRVPSLLSVVHRGTVFYRDYKGKNHLVTPVRMIDADDDLRVDWDSGERKEAADWARGLTGMKYRWMSDTYKGDPQGLIQTEYPYSELTRNERFKNPRILNMERKENGETVWMALFRDNWLVEIQEDVFLSLLFKQGITESQRILGTFRWGVFDSKMMLLEHRSEKYNILKKREAMKPKPPTPRTPKMDNKAHTGPSESYDSSCSICEGGNGGQICESCSRLVDGFKRWVSATDTMPKASTRFIITHKNLRSGNFFPLHTIFYNDRESAQSHLNTLGEDGLLYEVREIEIVYKD